MTDLRALSEFKRNPHKYMQIRYSPFRLGSGSDSDVVESSSQDLVSQFGNTTENDHETGSNRESEVTEEFEVGCGCNNRCYRKISADRVYQYRLNLAEFTKTEKDILLLAKMEQMEKKGDTKRGKRRECQRFG